MMRYYRVSPDGLPLLNGRKSTPKTFKEDDAGSNGRFSFSANDGCADGKSLRHRSGTSPSSTGGQDQSFPPSDSPQSDNPKPVHENGGPAILQWGQNKRRCPRAERAAGTDESSSPARQVIKVHRRSAVAAGGVSKPRSMAPVPYSRGTNLRPAMPVRDHHHSGTLLNRSTSEDHRSAAVASPSRLHNGSGPRSHPYRRSPDSQQQQNATNNHVKPQPDAKPLEPPDATEKVSSETTSGWPRIFLSLSRKEKEEDFFAMKGSKLPQRPKKRAKNVDKTLQYCLPGMWLSDLTRGRYEVREKKCNKKRRRGLKGMESMDSESE